MNERAVAATVRRKRASAGLGETTETEFLDAAERQFAENGYAGAKIRAIADEAKANLGALHYYWGSKESLFRAACGRRMAPMIEDRMARFDALGESPNSIEDILHAYFEPAFLTHRENPAKAQAVLPDLYAHPHRSCSGSKGHRRRHFHGTDEPARSTASRCMRPHRRHDLLLAPALRVRRMPACGRIYR